MDKRFIEQCESEELHLSGQIQPHGALLVLETGQVVHWSANLPELLPQLTLPPVHDDLPADLLFLVERLPQQAGSRLQFAAALDGGSGLLDVVLSRNALEQIVVELFPALGQPAHHGHPRLLDEVVELRAADQDGQQALIRKVIDLTGYHRVMYYRFREDEDGEVLAEIRQPGVAGSYLGLRFPASDIPQIARLLYLLNPWRQIPDTVAQPVAVHGRSAQLPDLSYSDLRSVSPIHLLYLGNMGVRASLSFPIVVAGRLWGLIACHHGMPRELPLLTLDAAYQEVRQHALAVMNHQSQRRMQLVDGLNRRFSEAGEMICQAGDVVAAWAMLGAWLAGEFAADGAQLCIGDRLASWGSAFEPEALAVVDEWFCAQAAEPLFFSDCLLRKFADYPLSAVAGVLAVKTRTLDGEPVRVYLTRHEHVHEVAWGGNPDKPVEYHDGTYGIAPRHSFEKWIEKRIGYSRPWDNEMRLIGLKLRELLMQLGRHG